jgi:hypothetical protein
MIKLGFHHPKKKKRQKRKKRKKGKKQRNDGLCWEDTLGLWCLIYRSGEEPL